MMFLLGSLAWPQKEARELAYSNWGVNVEPSVVTKAYSKEAVRDLIGVFTFAEYKTFLGPEIHEIGIEDLAWSEVHDLRGRLPGALGAVGALKWADVDTDGVYELLVTMDYSGRAFYNHLFIVKQVAGAYRQQEISINSSDRFMESPDELRNSDRGSWSTCCTVVVSDMDHDGTLELILPIELAFYRGAKPTPLWTSINKWKKHRFIEADEQFKGFYKEILFPNVERRIEVLSSGRSEGPGPFDELSSMEWLIKDKIVRLLGGDPRTGLERAMGWAKSANPYVRQNAAIALSEIPGEEAARHLEKLAADPGCSLLIDYILKKRREKARE